MKIIIFGAKGMLGQELGRAFQIGNLLYLLDRADLDILDLPKLTDYILDKKPDLIINAAAYNDVDKAESEFELAQKINGEAAVAMAKAAAKINSILIHYSTYYVFDGVKKEGYKEDDLPAPLSKYGQSKLSGEQARNYCTKCYLIRTSRLFGKTGTGDGAKSSFVDKILKVVETQNIVDIVNEEASNPTYANDLAYYTRYLLNKNLPFGIYHITNGGACTWYEFAKEIFRLSRKNVTINPVSGSQFNRPAPRPMYSSLLNTKLPKIRNWKEALAEYLKENK